MARRRTLLALTLVLLLPSTRAVQAQSPQALTALDYFEIGLGGDPNKIRHEGYYEDTYVRTSNGWRFASRIHHVPEGGTTGQSGRGGQQGQPAQPAQPTGAPNPER
jgi:hypothetical protein